MTATTTLRDFYLRAELGRFVLMPRSFREWKGEDGTYLTLMLADETSNPDVNPGDKIEMREPFGDVEGVYVVREITYDMRSAERLVSTIDLSGYQKLHRIREDNPDRYAHHLRQYAPEPVGVKPPPRFDSQVDADNWLALNDVPRQVFATGSMVEFEKVVPMVKREENGLIAPSQPVTLVGKVVSFKATYIANRQQYAHDDAGIGTRDLGPHYQLLILQEDGEPELTWVRAGAIYGLV